MEGTLNIRKSDTEMFVREISKESPEYPQKLLHYEGMPEILYVRGTLPDPRRPAVAIVGARAASPYGRMQAFRYARRLSEEGVQILSGMAYGIDTEAHRGALEGEGGTWAVLGNGVDICYPSGNRALYQRILREKCGILSEQPTGTRARNYFFPARNRIISGLADLVVIVEAREKSGSLITAQWALDQGKSVFAIPGPVTEELSMGCNKLIYDGADPKLILADEPTGALDSKAASALLSMFGEINDEGQTILMVTHSAQAASHASRVLFIKDGEVFHQIYKGSKSRQEMYQMIADTLTILTTGGEYHA